MKKFLVLLLVLGIATCAQAGMIFTVNGEPQPAEITLKPSETVELDLEWTQGSVSDYTLDYLLTPVPENPGQAEFIHTGTVFSGGWFVGNGYVGDPLPQSFEVSGSNFGIPYTAANFGFQGLILHCLGVGDVLMTVVTPGGTIIDGVPIEPGTVMHTLLIHQIPEPMTLTLLGLGGLFLARRKR